jgi:hypothetical protein
VVIYIIMRGDTQCTDLTRRETIEIYPPHGQNQSHETNQQPKQQPVGSLDVVAMHIYCEFHRSNYQFLR